MDRKPFSRRTIARSIGLVKRVSLEVIANSGTTPLLGVGLLLAKELVVDYTNLALTLLPKQKIY